MIFPLLLLLGLVIAGVASWFVARKVYMSSKAGNNGAPMFVAVLAFILCFAVLIIGIGWLIASTVRFER